MKYLIEGILIRGKTAYWIIIRDQEITGKAGCLGIDGIPIQKNFTGRYLDLQTIQDMTPEPTSSSPS